MPLRASPIHHRAAENIAFIRETLERSGQFSAVPGRGGVAMGLLAMAGALLASRQPDATTWLTTWIGVAIVGFLIAAGSMAAKARRAGVGLRAGPGRKFVFALAPSLVVAVLLTIPLASRGQVELLPPLWLLLYGTAITASGAFSLPALALMGSAFLGLGTAALFLPGHGDLFMAIGFGGLNLGFGFWIWRYHGG